MKTRNRRRKVSGEGAGALPDNNIFPVSQAEVNAVPIPTDGAAMQRLRAEAAAFRSSTRYFDPLHAALARARQPDPVVGRHVLDALVSELDYLNKTIEALEAAAKINKDAYEGLNERFKAQAQTIANLQQRNDTQAATINKFADRDREARIDARMGGATRPPVAQEFNVTVNGERKGLDETLVNMVRGVMSDRTRDRRRI